MGYIIPASILTRMVDELKVSMELEKELNCLEMRKFAEFPAGFQFLENPCIRKYTRLPEDLTGVYINEVSEFGWLHGILKVGDVLCKIDSHPIGYDGKVSTPEVEDGRIDFRLIISMKLVEEIVTLEFYRAEIEESGGIGRDYLKRVEVVVKDKPPYVPLEPPEGCYYMFAGLVFVPQSQNLVLSNLANIARSGGIENKILHSTNLPRKRADQQRIVVSTVLAHDINQCYDIELLAELECINGERVYNMKELVDTMEKLKQTRELWVILQFTSKIQLVFPLQDAMKATEEIMTSNNIIKAWDKIF